MSVDATFFGTDWTTWVNGVPDLDPLFGFIDGERTVQENCARRLMTPAGSLVGDPDYGFDLRTFLSARMTPVKKARMKAGIESELRKEERVDSALVEAIDITSATNAVSVTIVISTASGPFRLTLAVDQLTVTLLDS